MCSLQKKQEVFRFSGLPNVMIALQCGQGIFWPLFRCEKAMCPPQRLQTVFKGTSSGPARKCQSNRAVLTMKRYKNSRLKRQLAAPFDRLKGYRNEPTYPGKFGTPCHCNPNR